MSKRPGNTEKISISLDRADASALRMRARKLYGGNLSAAVAEGVRHIREEEGREALVAWLGSVAEAAPEEREAILAEWGGWGTQAGLPASRAARPRGVRPGRAPHREERSKTPKRRRAPAT